MVHTALYALLYGIVTVVGLTFAAERFGPGLLAIVGLSAVTYLVVGGTLTLVGWHLGLFERLLAALSRVLAALPGLQRFIGLLDTVRVTLLDRTDERFRGLFRDWRRVIAFIAVWTAGVVAVPAVRFWVLLTAVSTTDIGLVLLSLYIVVAYSVTILPLTPGGVGVAEATAVAVFVALGFPRSVVVPVIFLDRLLGVYLPSLAGWIPLVHADFDVKSGD